MNTRTIESVEAAWCQVGVLLPIERSGHSPDLERLLLETARQLSNQSRLFSMAASWLVAYGPLVAKHRLKRLITAELHADHQPALGLLLETAVELGATRELLIAAAVCRPASTASPLFAAYRLDETMVALAKSTATARSRTWGTWAPQMHLKPDIIRPPSWLLTHNETYAARAIRKGDLRCSILESLRRDAHGQAESEAHLARLSGATRAAVRKALAALILEGEVEFIQRNEETREHGVKLCGKGESLPARLE